MFRSQWLIRIFSVALSVAFSQQLAVADDFDREPILYRDTTPDNPVAKLDQALKSGSKKLPYD